MKRCKNINHCCSITYQKVNDYSVEIYSGTGIAYSKTFYTDGHIKPSKAIKKALKFLKSIEPRPNN